VSKGQKERRYFEGVSIYRGQDESGAMSDLSRRDRRERGIELAQAGRPKTKRVLHTERVYQDRGGYDAMREATRHGTRGIQRSRSHLSL